MSKIKVGISACILKASRSEERIPVFNGRPLAYVEYGMPDWISRYGGIPLMLPPPLGFYDLKVGEKIEDLQSFEASDFAKSLMGLDK